jgi:hypothetical protein
MDILKKNFHQRLLKHLIILWCLLIGVLGNNSFVECIELNNEEIFSHIQLFQCLICIQNFSVPESSQPVIGEKSTKGDEQCPFCLDIPLNFNTESIYPSDNSSICQGAFPQVSVFQQPIDFSSLASHRSSKEHLSDYIISQEKNIRTLCTVYLLI